MPAWGPQGTTPRLTVRGTTAGAPPPPPPPPPSAAPHVVAAGHDPTITASVPHPPPHDPPCSLYSGALPPPLMPWGGGRRGPQAALHAPRTTLA